MGKVPRKCLLTRKKHTRWVPVSGLWLLSIMVTKLACLACSEALHAPAAYAVAPPSALSARALRGGGQEDGCSMAKALEQIQAETWRELDDKGFIEVGQEDSEEVGAEPPSGQQRLPVALERLDRSRAEANKAPAPRAELADVVAQVGGILRAAGSKESLATSGGSPSPGPCADTASEPAAAGPTVPSAAQSIAAPPTLAAAGRAEEPVDGLHERPAEGDEVESLPPVKGMDGMTHLGGRSEAHVLSWGDEPGDSEAAAASQAARPTWSQAAGDVTVPGDYASLVDALAVTRPRHARILLHGGCYRLGDLALKIAPLEGAQAPQAAGEVRLCGNGAFDEQLAGRGSGGQEVEGGGVFAEEEVTRKGSCVRGRVVLAREGEHMVSDLTMRHESVRSCGCRV